jgi:hypothetical protein
MGLVPAAGLGSVSAKKLLVLTAVVALLFGFIFIFERRMPTTEEQTRKGDLYWDIPAEQIERIELARSGETLEFQRAGEAGWKMIKPERYPADPFAVGSVLSDLAELKRGGGEDANDARPADYGLEKPVAKATIVWRDPADPKSRKTRTIEFGAAVPGTDVVAARVEGTQKVLFVPAAVLASMRKSADDFESREVFEGVSADMTRLEILRGRGRLVFARKPGAWWLVEPMSDLGDAAEIDRLAASLLRLRVKEFVHGSQDLAAIGLDPALFRVSITGAKGAVTVVEFGATRSDGDTIYARREGQVVTADRDVLDGLSKEAEAFRGRTLLGFNRSDAMGVEAAFGKTSLVLEQKDGGWSSGGRPVLAATADDALGALLDLKIKEFVDEAAMKALDPAIAVVTVRVKSGGPWTLSLHPGAAGMIAQVSARPGGFLVDRDAATLLEAAIRKAVAEATPAKSPSPGA